MIKIAKQIKYNGIVDIYHQDKEIMTEKEINILNSKAWQFKVVVQEWTTYNTYKINKSPNNQ